MTPVVVWVTAPEVALLVYGKTVVEYEVISVVEVTTVVVKPDELVAFDQIGADEVALE